MGTTRGSKRHKPMGAVEEKLKEGQPRADPSSLGEGKKKPDRRFGKRQLTKEQLAEWRRKTTRKMKSSAHATLTNQLPEVLVSVLEEAHDGSCQHAKFLLEFTGPDGLRDAKEEQKNRSLTELLLENLGVKRESGSK